MAEKESLPAAGTKHLHVRHDRHLHRLRHVHGLPAAVLQSAAPHASPAPQAGVKTPASYVLTWPSLCCVAS